MAALSELGAENATPETYGTSKPPFLQDPRLITGRRFWELITPDGFPRGYDDLVKNATPVAAVAGDLETKLSVVVPMATVEDIFISKKAAGRPKDTKAFSVLAAAVFELVKGRRSQFQPQLPVLATSSEGATCGAWMPIARRHCSLKPGHTSHHH